MNVDFAHRQLDIDVYRLSITESVLFSLPFVVFSLKLKAERYYFIKNLYFWDLHRGKSTRIMPRIKKYATGIQPVSNDDLEEQLLRTVIIHPDSRYIRMCRPNDREAVLLPHCIARRQKEARSPSEVPKLPESFRSLHPNASNKEFKAAVASAEMWLKENCNEEKVSGRPYCSFDAKEIEDNPTATKEYYIGNEALDVIAINPNYLLSWPLKYGRFDLHEGEFIKTGFSTMRSALKTKCVAFEICLILYTIF